MLLKTDNFVEPLPDREEESATETVALQPIAPEQTEITSATPFDPNLAHKRLHESMPRRTIHDRTSDDGRIGLFMAIMIMALFVSMFAATALTLYRGGDLRMAAGIFGFLLTGSFVLALAVVGGAGRSLCEWILVVGHNLYSLFDRWCTHRVEMKRVKAELAHKQAQVHFNAAMRQQQQARIQAQVERHSQPQGVKNQLANYRPPRAYPIADLEPPPFVPATPSVTDLSQDEDVMLPEFDDTLLDETGLDVYEDTMRSKLLLCILDLYAKDDQGQYIHIKPDGQVRKGVTLAWTMRGTMNETERIRALTLLENIAQYRWLLRHPGRGKAWELNLRAYPHFRHAIDIIDEYETRL